ncbi:hypothetical protein V498_05922 [Pseudogymnoascus sp. VKM F-4517 (FW-2822)]|nr:hypothetical protein V498_05922 [Pseudogymnoascus sp. VKM F-4517 (FW-2822)]
MSTSSGPMGVQPAIFGGIPSRGVDIPICAVFIACFLAIGATHMTIFQKNRRRGHKFVPSALCFGFSMARVATFTMRIVWATRPTNQNVTIAANALVAAGVILLWCINRVFATRLLGEFHPRLYTKPFFEFALRRLPYVVIICCIPMVLVAMVLQIKTTNPHIRVITGILLKVVISFFLVFTFSPFIVLAVTLLLPGRKSEAEVARMGKGKTSTKVAVIAIATTLLCWELGIRSATMLQRLPANAAPWYYSKAAFYVFVPAFELAVSCMFAATRVDRLFYVKGKEEVGVERGEEKGQTMVRSV